MEVPNETTVTPIKKEETPNFSAKETADRTRRSPPKIRNTKPNISKPIS